MPLPLFQVRWCHRQDHRQRRLPQIFIKGDNIVLISPAQQYDKSMADGAGGMKRL